MVKHIVALSKSHIHTNSVTMHFTYPVMLVSSDKNQPVNWCYVDVLWQGLPNTLQFVLQNRVHDLNNIKLGQNLFFILHPKTSRLIVLFY